jgi:hypothetical protein
VANYKRLSISGAEWSHSELAVGATIGAQDTNLSSKDWRSGYQDSGNEISIYIVLIVGLVSGEEQVQSK